VTFLFHFQKKFAHVSYRRDGGIRCLMLCHFCAYAQEKLLSMVGSFVFAIPGGKRTHFSVVAGCVRTTYPVRNREAADLGR
jgi:hypothetical protein